VNFVGAIAQQRHPVRPEPPRQSDRERASRDRALELEGPEHVGEAAQLVRRLGKAARHDGLRPSAFLRPNDRGPVRAVPRGEREQGEGPIRQEMLNGAAPMARVCRTVATSATWP
jgi:hypothetical protein